VGTVTNYVQQPAPPSDAPIPIEGESPMYIDGARANITLDGMQMSAQQFQNYINTGMIGGVFGFTMSMMRQFDARFTDVRLRLFDANRWRNFGSIEEAERWANGRPGTIRARLNFGSSFSLRMDTYAKLRAIRLNSDITKMLRRNVERNLNESCASYIKKLIEAAAAASGSEIKSTNILDLFDKVASNSGGPDSEGYYGGIWGYLQSSRGSTAGGHWKDGVASIGLAMANHARPIAMSVDEFNNLPDGPDKMIRTVFSFHRFVTSQDGAFTTIHELIHLSLVGPGDDDLSLAQAALGITGERFDTTGLTSAEQHTIGSQIWGNRLADGCGAKRPHEQKGLEKYIKPVR
jgi:hypothetical protein